MTTTKFFPRRLLWVDAQPSVLDQAGRYFQACHLAVRFVDNFEKGLVEVDTRSPHLLLLDYNMPTSAMAYETFVHTRLPLVDPYRMTGPLANNPWQHTAIPILLVAGDHRSPFPVSWHPTCIGSRTLCPSPLNPAACSRWWTNYCRIPNPGSSWTRTTAGWKYRAADTRYPNKAWICW